MLRVLSKFSIKERVDVVKFLAALMGVLVLSAPSVSLACDTCNAKMKEKIIASDNLSLTEMEVLNAIKNEQGNNASKLALNVAPTALVAAAVATKAAAAAPPAQETFPEILKRDAKLPIPQTSWVPQNTKHDKEFIVELDQGDAYIGNGVVFKGFTTNGKIPGPTFIAEEGDVIRFTVKNKGTIPHGASLHAAYTQTSKYMGKVDPGTEKSFVFKATVPGVYMYHCAPGGHAIPIHILYGQYGMMVVKPKKQYKLEQMLKKKPDLELFLVQHEYYASGKDAIEARPMYTAFNGKMFRYVEEPIKAKPGDYVRINYLNVGPNLSATFHLVGIIWDFAYWQGNPDVVFPGGQSVIAGPTDSWVVEFRVPPEEGAYLMLSHAVGSTDRGAIGILLGDKNAPTPTRILADGPEYTDQQKKEFLAKATRVISPFAPGSPDVDVVQEYPAGTKEVIVRIIGNSYFPKRVRIHKGTKVRWINEDAFTYLSGEFSGLHNVAVIKGPESFASPMLSHAQAFTKAFTKPGKYEYMCTPHPYMRGEVEVK